jgi:hypothetical protein
VAEDFADEILQITCIRHNVPLKLIRVIAEYLRYIKSSILSGSEIILL